MSSDNSITFIMPVYNSSLYILDKVEDLLSKLDENRLIVIDDFSSDNSYEILCCIKDPRLTVLRNHCNKGVSYTRNRGIQLVNTEYLCFVDADDRVSDLLFKNIPYLNDKYPNVDVIRFSNSQSNEVLGFTEEYFENSMSCFPLYENSYYLHSSCTQIVKTSVLRDNDIYFDEKFCFGEDLLFTFNLMVLGVSCLCLSDKWYIYTDNELSVSNSVSSSTILRRIEDISKVYQNIFSVVPTEILDVFIDKSNNEISMQSMKLFAGSKEEYYNNFFSIKKHLIYNRKSNQKMRNIYNINLLLIEKSGENPSFLLRLYLNLYKVIMKARK